MFSKKGFAISLVVVALVFAAHSAGLFGETTQAVVAMKPENTAAIELASGTLALQDTENAITVEQSDELYTLWNAYAVLSDTDGVADAELDAVLTSIEEAMTDSQLAAIEDMELDTAWTGAPGDASDSEREASAAEQGTSGEMAMGVEMGIGGDMGGDVTSLSAEQMQSVRAEKANAGGNTAAQLAAQVAEMLSELTAEA